MGKKKRAREEAARAAECLTAAEESEREKKEALSRRNRRASLTGHAKLTPEERSERARLASRARWDTYFARQAAEGGSGEPKEQRVHPSASALEPYYVELDVRFPDREWSDEERRREAELLMRRDIAERALGKSATK